jgi:uncharacterized protein (DUF433 family)
MGDESEAPVNQLMNNRVEINADVIQGKPLIRGTGIPVGASPHISP